MKKLAMLVVFIALTSCSSIKTSFDFDKGVDFTKYKTYAFSEDAVNLKIYDLNRKRLLTALENELIAKGFTNSPNPDIIVDIHVKGQQYQTATATTSGAGYGGYYGYRGYRYGSGFTSTQVSYDQYTEGTLTIAFIDKAISQIVWQGTGVKTIDENASAAKREENINYAVKQIMANYPPISN